MTEKPTGASLLISKASMLKAERLSKYFVAMAKKIKVNTMEVKEMKTAMIANKSMNTKDKFKELYTLNPELNRSEVAELLNVSRKQIQRYIAELSK
jgi:predicted HTH transcriptional regulator